MIKTLKRVRPLQCGKVTGLTLGLVTLFLFVPIFLMFRFMSLMNPANQPGTDDPATLFVGIALTAAAMPVVWGVFGFLLGSIGAQIYNWTVRRIGGIEFEVE